MDLTDFANFSKNPNYLNQTIDLFLDDQLTSGLNIDSDLQGKTIQSVYVSGYGNGTTSEEAETNSLNEMMKLKAVLISGPLPTQFKISKIE